MDRDEADQALGQQVMRVVWLFSWLAGLELAGALLYQLVAGPGQPESPRTVLAALSFLGGALLIGCAFALAGGAVGFLFAIPKSRQVPTDAPSGSAEQNDYSANTNLEQVSDWLTKILLGAGLVELRELPGMIMRAARTFAGALGGSSADPVAAALIVSFTCWGFFLAYLLTRLWMPRALSRAERREREERLTADVADVTSKVFAALYDPPPLGYQRALALLDELERERGGLQDPWLLVYRACALGQQHAHEGRGPPDDEALRQKVRHAVRAALLADPKLKTMVASFYDGEGVDDDLRTLRPDPEIEGLLGIAPEPHA